jgi:hypothetical protein
MLPEPVSVLVPVPPLAPVSPVVPPPVSVLPAVVPPPASLAVAGVVSSPVVLHAASRAAVAMKPANFHDLVMLVPSEIY